MMPSPQPILNAMVEVKKELQVHFTHLSNPQLDASEQADRHQRYFNLMLDELEEQALAVKSRWLIR